MASQCYPDPLGEFIIASWERAAPLPRLELQLPGRHSEGEEESSGRVAGQDGPAAALRVCGGVLGDVWTSMAGSEDPWLLEVTPKVAEDPWLQDESPLTAAKKRKRPVPKHLQHLACHQPGRKNIAPMLLEDPWQEVDVGCLDPWGAEGW